jgi:tRNA 2-selenouridine synthase
MRSGSFAWLMNTAGIESYILKGGYKSYKNFAIDFFSDLNNLILLGGETGSGKTEILKGLSEAGEQVVDLEALANHKGSSFGGLSGKEQPTNEQFQNNLLLELMKMDLSKRIWLEDESHSIGSIRIPDILWFKMRAAPVVRLQVLQQDRVNRLVRDYGNIDRELLATGITRISKKIGGLEASKALEFLKSNNLEKVAEICLFYYDKAYNTGLRHRVHDLIYNLELHWGTTKSCLIQEVIMLADNIFSSESA